jgi:hypothetical protein
MGDRTDVFCSLAETSERKPILGRLRRRWSDNIKMDLQVLVCEAMGCIDLA